MRDPREGVTSLGAIRTGASRDRVAAFFAPALDAAVSAVRTAAGNASLYLYGSVATGMAQPGRSDVDLLTVGIPSAAATDIARVLSERFSDHCRAVEIAAAQRGDFAGDSDQAYGGRVFLRHYCVHLTGPDLHSGLPEFAADARAARGFNGDIARSAGHWRIELDGGTDPVILARRLARKTLLAVAGLVSVHDRSWTTDRAVAASRWAEIDPTLAGDLQQLLAWCGDDATPHRSSVAAAITDVVPRIVACFEDAIGLWNSEHDH